LGLVRCGGRRFPGRAERAAAGRPRRGRTVWHLRHLQHSGRSPSGYRTVS